MTYTELRRHLRDNPNSIVEITSNKWLPFKRNFARLDINLELTISKRRKKTVIYYWGSFCDKDRTFTILSK